ncbi:MAG TPA: hypothetical protein VJ873_04200 [bacterium]|nr:hypothetical protein [bacterium]
MDLAMKQDPRPLARLVKGKPISAGRKVVEKLSEESLDTAKDPNRLRFIQGALYLCFDCFDEAHTVANDHEGTVAGNWIHAMAHRREPDASNSKYWYHRVSVPAKVSGEIAAESLALLKKSSVPELESLAKKIEKSKHWEPEAFVDLCDEFRKKDDKTPVYRALAAIQEIEWRGLAEYILSS